MNCICDFWVSCVYVSTHCTHQGKAIVDCHQLLHAILLQDHYAREILAAQTCAVLAVHHVHLLAAVLAGHEQQVEHLHLQRETQRLLISVCPTRQCSSTSWPWQPPSPDANSTLPTTEIFIGPDRASNTFLLAFWLECWLTHHGWSWFHCICMPWNSAWFAGSTHVTLIAVVGGLILHSALVGDLFPSCHQLVPQDLDVLNRLQKAVSEGRGGGHRGFKLTTSRSALLESPTTTLWTDHASCSCVVTDLFEATHHSDVHMKA